jgi:FkbM family methyltransferase
MFSIEYVDKCEESPTGKVVGRIFEEVSWLYNENEFPFKFEILSNENTVWSVELYPDMWASWDTLDTDNFVAIIKNNKNEIISQFNHDIWVNRNATEQFFDTWINMNPNSKGIVIGTHDGTTGEWVKHVKNKSTHVVLVEASKKQFNELTQNYLNFNNVSFRNDVITGDGGNVKFYEFGLGYTNTLSEAHYKKHINNDELNIVNMVSVSINDLIIQEKLESDLDWLHLDTESIDDEIIMSLDFDKIVKPKLIVFETINFSKERTGSSERIDKLFNWLELNGYRVKYDYWNSFAFLIPHPNSLRS